MNFTFEIAKRYLLAKKSTSAVNIITWISVIGITIGTSALILILSVFNGFESLLSGLYNSFNPDLKIVPIDGKYFELDSTQIIQLDAIEGIIGISKTVEEVCIFEYKDIQKPGIIKGVDSNYKSVTSIDSTIESGDFKLKEDRINFGVLGKGLSINLSINHKDALTPVKAFMPIRKNTSILNKMGKEFKQMNIYPSGTFAVGSEADVQYIITNYESVNRLLSQENKISALEIKLSEDHDEDEIRAELVTVLGDNFAIKNRYDQEESFLKIMNIEKWISFLIVVLVLGIIAFNMIGSLWMMVLEKKKDIAILRSMGLETKNIRNIFLMEGIIITGVGLILGTLLALILYYLQKYYGLVTIPDGFMISAYPIELKWTDFVIVTATVVCIGWLASILPAYRAGKVSAFVREEL
ncbi:MAG: FtsX-like permease family protein [Saprospiraceae bacterium]|nr:FtsX-like permease family protein [Saprospiraceae bacterium]